MPLKYAFISPHPPIIIPEIGQDQIQYCQKTVNAMLNVSLEASEKNPDLIIIISPHGIIYPHAISLRIPSDGTLIGSFADFGLFEPVFQFINDNDFGLTLINNCINANLKIQGIADNSLDHGALVPLYYLERALNKKTSILTINISLESNKKHYEFGKILSETIEKDPRNIVFIASGDLSHRLTPNAPAGYSSLGKKFDNLLIEMLEQNETERILNLDPFFCDEAGECGLRSICTFLGIIENMPFKKNKISYEGPFGVGYLVMSAS
ncbi:MAG: hypothetical protein UR27_C0013G0036 [Candidatus Peregrinibacteria bacterium GW2011_GWA2_33_10]|nr:MAG: hypothetical protein UR27_C0013G0036 [Candidatus Peregrinibacteria bacterium GW2011_GWA2_33_10]KKP39168.1 MAG: hypothetical protein UR30_C0012G0041 [Candidatus Peregrinibacteria bacterium GW2011_GWC2_33_13]